MRKLTNEEFITRSMQVHSGKYDYNITTYKGCHNKVKINCPKHGVFEQRACDHLQGCGCSVCVIESSNHNRLEQHVVAAYFKNRQCVLLDMYQDSKSPLRYVCKCGKESLTNWNNFKNGCYCKDCGNKQAHNKTRRSQDEVEQLFADAGCVLLDTYINANGPLEYICKCGKRVRSSYSCFKNHKRCLWCSGKAKPDFQCMLDVFSANGCLLHDKNYVNAKSPLRFTCKCGEVDSRCWSSIRLSGTVQCDKCAGIAKPTQEEIEYLFESEGCKLLDTYVGAHSPVKYICKCGTNSVISVNSFKKGSRCKKCGKDKSSKLRRFDISHVRVAFEKAGCTLIENEYVNSYQRLEYICNCGRKAKINWQQFRDGKRCYACGKKKNHVSGADHHAWNPDRDCVEIRRKISNRCGSLVRRCLNLLGRKKVSKTEMLLGYSRIDLMQHITLHPNWCNIKDKNWHIDHIFPVKAFIDYGITDLKVINCLSNLRPVEAGDNLSKGDTYDREAFARYIGELKTHENSSTT